MNYENSFIAAEKGNDFLVKVLTKYMEMLESTWDKIYKYMVESGVDHVPKV